jgi:branched-chain amino acid transport system ATP-binding protein
MSRPKMILLDEPSMGLAPRIVEEIFDIVATLNAQLGISYLVAEQNALVALKYAQHGYVMENGRVVLEGTADELKSNDDIREFYLGVAGGDRINFRDTKSYSRRKRWLS